MEWDRWRPGLVRDTAAGPPLTLQVSQLSSLVHLKDGHAEVLDERRPWKRRCTAEFLKTENKLVFYNNIFIFFYKNTHSLTESRGDTESPHADDFSSSDQFTVSHRRQVQRDGLSNKGVVALLHTSDAFVQGRHKAFTSLHVFVDSTINWVVGVLCANRKR